MKATMDNYLQNSLFLTKKEKDILYVYVTACHHKLNAIFSIEMDYILHLSQLSFKITGISANEVPANTLLFCDKGKEADISFTYNFHFRDTLPTADASWMATYQRPGIMVWTKGKLECRLLRVSGPGDTYAFYEETSPTHANIYFLNTWRDQLNIDTIFNSCLALERRMSTIESYILHCSYIVHDDHAILFSGPSGVGKSTHAELWQQYVDDTRIINGDRCLITHHADDTYMANGWPVCGSSGICHDESHPLSAIVFIEQTPDNQVIEETTAQHFRRLYAQLTINRWNQEATNKAINWMQALISKVNLVTYGCNMLPNAPFPLLEHLSNLKP